MSPWALPYVPILRGGPGELEGLGWLPDDAKDRVAPLVEVPPGSFKATAERLAVGWGQGRPVLLDTVRLDPSAEIGGRHHLIDLFDRCRGHIKAVPVGGLGRGIDHTATIAGIVAAEGHGAGLRLDAGDLAEPGQRDRQIEGWLAVVDMAPEEVDLVLDVGEISEPSQVGTLLATHQLLAALPYADEWRSLTLAGGAFPHLSPNGHTDSEQLFERLDWRLWETVSHGELPRPPGFGDHVLARPGSLESPPGPAIVYTSGPSWLVVKRHQLAPSFDELRAASQLLLGRPEFAGAAHCRGCAHIQECAAGGSTGRWEAWRAAGTCHHIQTSVAQISGLG